MEENNKKNVVGNSLLEWYKEIPRRKRNKFILALQLKFGFSASGVYDKLKKDNWRDYEREIVADIINDGSWEI